MSDNGLERFRRMLRVARRGDVRPAPAPAQKKEVATVRDEARESRAIAPPPVPAGPAPKNDEKLEGPRWRRQCEAKDAATARRCSLLAGHRGAHNASGREFWWVLTDGEEAAARELDMHAQSRPGSAQEGI